MINENNFAAEAVRDIQEEGLESFMQFGIECGEITEEEIEPAFEVLLNELIAQEEYLLCAALTKAKKAYL